MGFSIVTMMGKENRFIGKMTLDAPLSWVDAAHAYCYETEAEAEAARLAVYERELVKLRNETHNVAWWYKGRSCGSTQFGNLANAHTFKQSLRARGVRRIAITPLREVPAGIVCPSPRWNDTTKRYEIPASLEVAS